MYCGLAAKSFTRSQHEFVPGVNAINKLSSEKAPYSDYARLSFNRDCVILRSELTVAHE